VAGDALLLSDAARVAAARAGRVCNALVLKPSQLGTVTVQTLWGNTHGATETSPWTRRNASLISGSAIVPSASTPTSALHGSSTVPR
jgi:hypothetical protein